MLKYIVKRLALSVLILLGVSLIIYVLIRCMPVDYVTQKLSSITTTGAETSQEVIDAMMKTYDITDKKEIRGFFNQLRQEFLDWHGTEFESPEFEAQEKKITDFYMSKAID